MNMSVLEHIVFVLCSMSMKTDKTYAIIRQLFKRRGFNMGRTRVVRGLTFYLWRTFANVKFGISQVDFGWANQTLPTSQ